MRNKLFNYLGAKTAILPILYQNFPKNHTEMKYVEVFGGSGVVLYNKPKSLMEIFNDYDAGISAIFWCLTNEFEQLCFRLQYAHHSELVYQWFKEYEPKTKVDLAVKTIYETHMAFSGKRGDTFVRVPNLINKRDNRFLIFDFNLFDLWNRRFKKVQIYSEDFESCIQRTDEVQTFFYLDPPYVCATKGYYGLTFAKEDHERLARTLSDIQGNFLLSYDDDPLVHDLYSEFYNKKITVKYKAGNANRDKERTELLIANYPLPRRTKLTEFVELNQEEVTS